LEAHQSVHLRKLKAAAKRCNAHLNMLPHRAALSAPPAATIDRMRRRRPALGGSEGFVPPPM